MIKSIFYVKKMQLPSNSASVLQTLNMVWAFAENNCSVKICINSKDNDIARNIVSKYRLNRCFKPEFFCIKTKNKGIYSILFYLYFVKNWIFNKKSIFFARDLKEGYWISFFKKYLKRDHVFIYEMHDSVYLEKINSLKIDDLTIYQKENLVLNSADLVIYTGPYLKKIVESLYNPQSAGYVVPPGYNPNIFTPVMSEISRQDSFKLAYFGTLFPGKGVDVFLEALYELPHPYTGVVLGGNPAKRLEELQYKAKALGLGRRVRFFGQVPPSSVSTALMGVDAVVIPFQTSTEFLSPIKLYESLALGLPIIATPMPALVELSKTIKSLVVAADCTPKSLATCIQSLFSDKDRLCITKEIARNRYEVYTWSTRAKMILNNISDKFE